MRCTALSSRNVTVAERGLCERDLPLRGGQRFRCARPLGQITAKNPRRATSAQATIFRMPAVVSGGAKANSAYIAAATANAPPIPAATCNNRLTLRFLQKVAEVTPNRIHRGDEIHHDTALDTSGAMLKSSRSPRIRAPAVDWSSVPMAPAVNYSKSPS